MSQKPFSPLLLTYQLYDLLQEKTSTITITDPNVTVGNHQDAMIVVRDPQTDPRHLVLCFTQLVPAGIAVSVNRVSQLGKIRLNNDKQVGDSAPLLEGDTLNIGYGATFKILSIKPVDANVSPKLSAKSPRLPASLDYTEVTGCLTFPNLAVKSPLLNVL